MFARIGFSVGHFIGHMENVHGWLTMNTAPSHHTHHCRITGYAQSFDQSTHPRILRQFLKDIMNKTSNN
jgi:hypothetical protein